MKSKYQDMGDRGFLLVPAFDERVKDHPLDSVGALVYAYLLFLVRNKKPERRSASRTKISLSLQLDKKAVDKAVGILIQGGLVRELGSRVEAVESGAVSCGWFRRRNQSKGCWYDGFVVDRVFLPKSSTTLSVRTNQLFWRLMRISHPVAGMPGYHQAGAHPERPPRYLSAKYLARGLGCDRRTATRALRRLRRLKLITVQQVGPKRFVVGIPPVGESATLWRDGWTRAGRKEEPVEITAESLFAVPSPETLEPAKETQTGVGLLATSFGITGKILEEIITTVTNHRVPPSEWEPLLKLADQIHRQNREKDPDRFKTRHCGRLFKSMLTDLVAKRNAGEKIASENVHRYPGYDEVESHSLLDGLRVTYKARMLLRRAVSEDRLSLRNGGCIPCGLHWEHVRLIATAAKGDYERFRDDIAASIFGNSENRADCQWYLAWMNESQIPDWDYSPLEALGIGRWDFDRFRSHAEELVRAICDWQDGVRAQSLANLLIKYGCKEAAEASAEKVLEAMTAAFDRVMKNWNGKAAGSEETHEKTPVAAAS